MAAFHYIYAIMSILVIMNMVAIVGIYDTYDIVFVILTMYVVFAIFVMPVVCAMLVIACIRWRNRDGESLLRACELVVQNAKLKDSLDQHCQFLKKLTSNHIHTMQQNHQLC